MFEIFITDIEKISEEEYNYYFSQLPIAMKYQVSKYRFKDDRYRTIAGKIMLLKYLRKHTKLDLSNIKTSKYNKPYIENCDINFNISHSGKYTIAVFSNSNQIGVDIEDMSNEIDIDDFKSIFLENEFNQMQKSKNRLEKFYTIWTIKEAVLKAEGIGLIDDMKDVIIEDNKVSFKNRKYNIHTFKIDSYIYSIVLISRVV